uniref:Uncharacterized protein n=1 Tax=Romanomermis culicivorax TaxID=13658 RepID=A0A915LA87_ROMCU
MPPNCSIDKDFKLGHFTGTFRNCVMDKLPVEKEDKFEHRSKTTSINLEKALSVDDEHGTPTINEVPAQENRRKKVLKNNEILCCAKFRKILPSSSDDVSSFLQVDSEDTFCLLANRALKKLI